MPGRSDYSRLLADITRQELAAAIARLPGRRRLLLERSEIDRAPHKIVAAELQLSMRQFYRERALAIRSVLSGATTPTAIATLNVAAVPIGFRMLFVAIAAAIEANDAVRVRATVDGLHDCRSEMPPDVAALADIMLALGDAVVARMNGDPQRAKVRLGDVARATKDLQVCGYDTPSATYGLTAMLSLAEELLYRGETDGAIRLAADVHIIAANLIDPQLEIDAETVLVHAYLALPCHASDAYTRAVRCVRRCTSAMKPRIIVRALRALACALACALAELGWFANALTLRDIAEPLASALLGATDRLEHQLWCSNIELQCGSAARAAELAAATRERTGRDDRVYTAATLVQAHALLSLGLHAQSVELARNAQAVSERHGWRRIAGDAKLVCARNALAAGDVAEAREQLAAAIRLLDRAAPVSVQQHAYALSFELTRNPLHKILADALAPEALAGV